VPRRRALGRHHLERGERRGEGLTSGVNIHVGPTKTQQQKTLVFFFSGKWTMPSNRKRERITQEILLTASVLDKSKRVDEYILSHFK
jgi:hypothetical protein